MGAEGLQIREAEIDPRIDFDEVVADLTKNILNIAALVQARESKGSTLSPEEQAKLDALQDRIADSYVQPL